MRADTASAERSRDRARSGECRRLANMGCVRDPLRAVADASPAVFAVADASPAVFAVADASPAVFAVADASPAVFAVADASPAVQCSQSPMPRLRRYFNAGNPQRHYRGANDNAQAN